MVVVVDFLHTHTHTRSKSKLRVAEIWHHSQTLDLEGKVESATVNPDPPKDPRATHQRAAYLYIGQHNIDACINQALFLMCSVLL